jgi:hypothetical protein
VEYGEKSYITRDNEVRIQHDCMSQINVNLFVGWDFFENNDSGTCCVTKLHKTVSSHSIGTSKQVSGRPIRHAFICKV